jgi:hypothetical protein
LVEGDEALSEVRDDDALLLIVHEEARLAEDTLGRVVGVAEETPEGVGLAGVTLLLLEVVVELADVALRSRIEYFAIAIVVRVEYALVVD